MLPYSDGQEVRSERLRAAAFVHEVSLSIRHHACAVAKLKQRMVGLKVSMGEKPRSNFRFVSDDVPRDDSLTGQGWGRAIVPMPSAAAPSIVKGACK